MATSAPVWAQAGDATSSPVAEKAPGDIVVTATRRSTLRQSTAGSISVISQETLANSGAHLIQDLGGSLPNVNIPRFGLSPSAQNIFIRGIGTTQASADAAVGTYIDDVYIPRSIATGALVNLDDVTNIEVLRGPQGTLYGRNSSAGALKFTSRAPDNDLVGSLSLTGGSYKTFQLNGMMSGPLIRDKLYASIAYTHNERGGTVDAPNLGYKVSNVNIDAARIKIRATPTETLDITLTADGAIDDSTPPYRSVMDANGQFDPKVTTSTTPPLNQMKTGGVSLRGSLELDDHLTLNSITALRAFRWYYLSDNVGAPGLVSGTNQDFHDRTFSQELQLQGDYDRFNFTAGLFFFDEKFDVVGATIANGRGSTYTENTSYIKSIAGFAQGTYEVLDGLKLTLGLRYSRDKTRFVDANYVPQSLPTPGVDLREAYPKTTQIFAFTGRAKFNALTPKIGLEYKATSNIFLFATYADGYKAGGFDTRSSSLAAVQEPFSPERVKSYEAGIKTSWMAGHVILNLTGFYNDYQNFQASVYVTPRLLRLTNAGNAHTEGFEAEANFGPFGGFTWTNQLGYTKAIYDSFPNAGSTGQDYSGNTLPYAPRWSASSGLNWTIDTGAEGKLILGGEVAYMSKTYSDSSNEPIGANPANTVFNANATYEIDAHWKLNVAVRNLTDKRYNVFGVYRPPNTYATGNPPRMITATVKYSF